MKILELFSGSKTMSNTFKAHGHETFTVDIEKKYEPDLCIDIMDFKCDMVPFKPDVIWASPPCTTFSVASMSAHWTGGARKYIPKTEECKRGIARVHKTLDIINELKPRYWFIENPVGVLRKLKIMPKYKRTVTYCQYGDNRMKPTDIWTNAYHWIPRKRCSVNDRCHEPAPRGSNTGTQGLKNNYERSKIPVELCEEIVAVCEDRAKKIQRTLEVD